MAKLSSKKSILKKPKAIKTVESKNIIDPFQQFDIKTQDVEQALEGVIKFVSSNPKTQNQLFDDDLSLFLQINSFKVPSAGSKVKKVFRVPLQHSILAQEADICLIVPDVKGIRNDEHQQHLEHYEKLLESKNVTGIKKIMTFHEFRTEYDTFELKRRLVDLYDVFLVDGKISGKVVHKCGKIFYEKRKLPVAIKLAASELKKHIENTLKKVFFQMKLHGDSHSIQIGHHQMPVNQLKDNIYSIVGFLNKNFPGKMANIRSLSIYAHRGSSIPIYMSLKNPNDVKVPVLRSKKPNGVRTEIGELTTRYNAVVEVKPGGKVVVIHTKNKANNHKGDFDVNKTENDIKISDHKEDIDKSPVLKGRKRKERKEKSGEIKIRRKTIKRNK